MGGRVTADGVQRTRLAGALVGLLGLLLAVAQLWHLRRVESPVAIIVESVFPLAFALVLVGVGYAVARGTVVGEPEALRFAGWVAGGAGTFLFTDAWIVALDVVLGYDTPGRVIITTNAVTLGAVVGAIVGLYDARSREQTRRLQERERRLTRQNRQLDDFVSVVSHDLRNPLNVATARVDLAREECDSDHLDEDGFYVADDGPGIPDSEHESVFESGYSTSTDGTGFGLSIVREIVDAHGWEIDVAESEDGGARFDVTGVGPP